MACSGATPLGTVTLWMPATGVDDIADEGGFATGGIDLGISPAAESHQKNKICIQGILCYTNRSYRIQVFCNALFYIKKFSF